MMNTKHTIETKCRLLHPSGKKVVGVIYVDGKPAFQTDSMNSVEEVLQAAQTIRENFEALKENWIHHTPGR